MVGESGHDGSRDLAGLETSQAAPNGPAAPGILPGLRGLLRNRFVQVAGALVIGGAALLHGLNHRPIHETPDVDPAAVERLREILDALPDQKPGEQNGPSFSPGDQDINPSETALG